MSELLKLTRISVYKLVLHPIGASDPEREAVQIFPGDKLLVRNIPFGVRAKFQLKIHEPAEWVGHAMLEFRNGRIPLGEFTDQQIRFQITESNSRVSLLRTTSHILNAG